ncbi:MAG: hypothetical protein QXI60_03190 [Thermofilaceae archaeon]
MKLIFPTRLKRNGYFIPEAWRKTSFHRDLYGIRVSSTNGATTQFDFTEVLPFELTEADFLFLKVRIKKSALSDPSWTWYGGFTMYDPRTPSQDPDLHPQRWYLNTVLHIENEDVWTSASGVAYPSDRLQVFCEIRTAIGNNAPEGYLDFDFYYTIARAYHYRKLY